MNIKTSKSKIIFYILFALTLIIGVFFRVYGINWDQDFHLHPDERFLTMVANSISPVSSVSEYFDTNRSSLNPHNVLDINNNSVFPFFVYGTLPLFIVRYTAELFGQSGYGEIHIVGRHLSAFFDIGTIFFIFLTARKIFENKWLSLTASFLYTCSVLPIQISHFFIVDNFTTFFSTLTLFASVRILKEPDPNDFPDKNIQFLGHKNLKLLKLTNYILFGVALGMAAASKINAVVLAGLLPAAILLREINNSKNLGQGINKQNLLRIIFCGLISLIVFRIFQPYAFSGPNFVNFSLNPRWVNNLRELSIISSGSSNYPPSLQWARRSVFFPIKNLIVWGMGLPLGIFSMFGLVYMGWFIIKGEWKKYGLLWTFTFLYLLWQLALWNPTMRYFLIIYPPLAIIAAWFLIEIIFGNLKQWIDTYRKGLGNFLSLLLAITLIGGTFFWAISFMNIYRQPMTRINASEWIYENIESAVNLKLAINGFEINQPLSTKNYDILLPDEELEIVFQPNKSGDLTFINFEHVSQQSFTEEEQILTIELFDSEHQTLLFKYDLVDYFLVDGDSRGRNFKIENGELFALDASKEYLLKLKLQEGLSGLRFFGTITVGLDQGAYSFNQAIHLFSRKLTSEEPYIKEFTPLKSGQLKGIELFRVKSTSSNHENIQIITEIKIAETGETISSSNASIKLTNVDDYRGQNIRIEFPEPVYLDEGNTYQLKVIGEDEDAILIVNGSKTAKETDWDDVLPLFMYGYNPFDSYEGLFPSDLNFQMYWDDNQDKLERFIEILDQSDYFIVTSNRQWGSTTQIPERYPLTTLFYKELIGCPIDDVQKCYRDAVPGKYNGNFGYSLIKTFQTNPQFLNLEFNSQYAEEAFTVYDHPKVLIFKKNDDFNIKQVADNLNRIDLRQVLTLSPKEAEKRPGTLLLNTDQWMKQKESGTWSQLFNYQNFQNSSPLFTVLIWYLCISVIGWMVFPITRIAFDGLPDKGISLIRPIGLLILSIPVWLAGSIKLDVTRQLIFYIFLLIFIFNIFLFLRNKSGTMAFIHQHWKLIIIVEAITLCLFLIFLAIRIGNPDLWHPFKGGEKPMDFSYLNAVIKSLNFPPYDPWYAGGYINYYYFGFVLAAIPIKFLGIVPSIAYNLVLPTFFSFTGMAVFSLVWNYSEIKRLNNPTHTHDKERFGINSFILGLFGIILVLFIGNLGTLKMIFEGFYRIAASNLTNNVNNIFGQISFYLNGVKLFVNGLRFPYYPGDWYWIPSRAIPGEPITEFPFFTFLYGDPHAHLFAYPYTIIVLSWGLSLINHVGGEKKLNSWDNYLKLLVGAVIVGSLIAMNTWDFPIYFGLANLALFTSFIKFYSTEERNSSKNKKIISAIIYLIVFSFFVIIIYSPFLKWYGQGYSSIQLWEGERTPLGAYVTHWGFFIFILGFFLISKFISLLAKTPLIALKPFFRYQNWIYLLLLACLLILGFLIYLGLQIIIFVFPLLFICSILFIFDSESILDKFLYIFIAVGLLLTLAVEVVVLRGDIGRMNTVFKFYLQAWTLLSLASALAFPSVYKGICEIKNDRIKSIWLIILIGLFISVILFPFMASVDKISDRIAENTPLTIDGMEYMKYSQYLENGIVMELEQDYNSIRWMQENIHGTPVIVEANIPEYRWGNRFSIYTGLPGVLGWNWHQRQQRAINPPEWIFNRVNDITDFYSMDDIDQTREFLKRYDVDYIVVGQLERATYPQEGLRKFDDFDQRYWDLVYSSENTQIYKVRN